MVDSERKLGQGQSFNIQIYKLVNILKFLMTKRAKSDKFMIPSDPFKLHIYLSIVAWEEEMRAILVAPTSDPILTSALKHDSQISLIL